MVVGEIAESVDLLVVGAGPGGYGAALRAAEIGRTVTVVDPLEWGGLGGTCLQVGCIPSKALIELSHVAGQVQRLAAAGLRTGEVRVDLAAFQSWKAGIVAGRTRGVEMLLHRRGVTALRGRLRFNRPDRAAVATADGLVRFVEFTDVVIATGSRPLSLPALPFDGELVLDSTAALALDDVPRRLVVVGGGYIGLELGTAFAKLGSAVTLVEMADQLLPGVDADLTRPVLRSLRRLGVDVLLGAQVGDAHAGEVVVTAPDGERRVGADKVVVAVGRTPNTDDLGLDALGVVTGTDGRISVDARCLAGARVAAVGDVTAGPALAHKAMAQADVAVHALSGRPAEFAPLAIPAVVFADPEVAVVGLTRQQATAAGMDAAVADFPFAASGRAATLQCRDGFARLVVDRAADAVVGAQVVGPHASELIAEASLAIEMGASPEDLAGTIHAHPTLGESWAEAAAVAVGRPLHVVG